MFHWHVSLLKWKIVHCWIKGKREEKFDGYIYLDIIRNTRVLAKIPDTNKHKNNQI